MVDLYHSGHISLDFVGSRLWFFDESHELLISPWAVAVQAQAPFGAEFHDETVETLVQDQLLGENDSLIRYCWSNQKFCSTTSCHLVAIHGYPKVFNALTLWLGRLQTTLGIEPLSPVFDKWLRISRSWSLTAKKTSTSPLIHHWFTTMFSSKEMPEIAASNIAPKLRRSGKCLAWKSCTTHLTLWIHHTGVPMI